MSVLTPSLQSREHTQEFSRVVFKVLRYGNSAFRRPAEVANPATLVHVPLLACQHALGMLERCVAQHQPEIEKQGLDGDAGLRVVRAALDFMQISMKVLARSHALLDPLLGLSRYGSSQNRSSNTGRSGSGT